MAQALKGFELSDKHMQLVAPCPWLQVHREGQLNQREALEEGRSVFRSDFIVKPAQQCPFAELSGKGAGVHVNKGTF